MEEEYKGKFGPLQSSELQISEKSTDQDQAIQGQQPATQVVVTGIEENDVGATVAKGVLRTAMKRLRKMSMEGRKVHCIVFAATQSGQHCSKKGYISSVI